MCPVFGFPGWPAHRGDGAGTAIVGIWRDESAVVDQRRNTSDDPLCHETLTMDMHDITEFLRSAARSLGAEVTSPWFYLQLGLILASAGIALAARAVIRSRVDPASLTLGWPP